MERRNGPCPRLISMRGRNSRSSRLGYFRLGGRKGSGSRSNSSKVGDRGRGPHARSKGQVVATTGSGHLGGGFRERMNELVDRMNRRGV